MQDDSSSAFLLPPVLRDVTWVGVDVEGSIALVTGTDENDGVSGIIMADDGVTGDAVVDGCMAGGLDIDADIAGFVTVGAVDMDADMDGCVAGSVDEDPDMDGCMVGRPDEDPDVDGCVTGGEVTAEVLVVIASKEKISKLRNLYHIHNIGTWPFQYGSSTATSFFSKVKASTY